MAIDFSLERTTLPHGSSILAFRDGKILACKRKTSDLWSYPGGKIGEGESPMVAAARELFEETGIQAPPGSLELVHEGVCQNRDPSDTAYWVYFFKVSDEQICIPKPMDGEPPFQWMTPQDFLAESAFPDFNELTLRVAFSPI